MNIIHTFLFLMFLQMAAGQEAGVEEPDCGAICDELVAKEMKELLAEKQEWIDEIARVKEEKNEERLRQKYVLVSDIEELKRKIEKQEKLLFKAEEENVNLRAQIKAQLSEQ